VSCLVADWLGLNHDTSITLKCQQDFYYDFFVGFFLFIYRNISQTREDSKKQGKKYAEEVDLKKN